MAYDEHLAERIGRIVDGTLGLSEKKMFGGVAFMKHGLMFCGLVKDELMVRVGPDQYEQALTRPHTRPMDFTGRPMKGYVYVAKPGLRTEAMLRGWIKRGLDFVATLPEKREPPPRKIKRLTW